MQAQPVYTDVVDDIAVFFSERISVCEAAGIKADRIWLDPGFGFGKTLQHNVDLLKRLDELNRFGLPILAGISRKSMIGILLGDRPVDDRVHGSVSAAVIAAMHGARMVRVHDVKETADALRIVRAVREYCES